MALRVRAAGARLVLDTSGAALRALVDSGVEVDVLRLDRAESEALSGQVLAHVSEVARFASALVARKVARMVVLALGAKGSVMALDGQVWRRGQFRRRADPGPGARRAATTRPGPGHGGGQRGGDERRHRAVPPRGPARSQRPGEAEPGA